MEFHRICDDVGRAAVGHKGKARHPPVVVKIKPGALHLHRGAVLNMVELRGNSVHRHAFRFHHSPGRVKGYGHLEQAVLIPDRLILIHGKVQAEIVHTDIRLSSAASARGFHPAPHHGHLRPLQAQRSRGCFHCRLIRRTDGSLQRTALFRRAVIGQKDLVSLPAILPDGHRDAFKRLVRCHAQVVRHLHRSSVLFIDGRLKAGI